MTTYVLDDCDSATIASRPIVVTVTGAAVRLVAHAGGGPAPGVRTGPEGELVLTRFEATTVLRIIPDNSSSVFAEGSVVSIRLRTAPTRGGDEDVVVVNAVEVSGRPFRDLVAVASADSGRLSVTAINAVVDQPLGPLASAARAAARARLAVDRTTDAFALIVAVDVSASMAAAVADGSVAATLDLVAGLSQVIGWDRDLIVCLMADRPVRLPPVPIKELVASSTDAIERFGLGYGFRAAPSDLPVQPRSLTYVITDGAPADIGALRAAHRPGDDLRQLVLLGDVGRPPDELGVPTTTLASPPPGVDASTHLLAHPYDVSDLVGSMLSGLTGRTAAMAKECG